MSKKQLIVQSYCGTIDDSAAKVLVIPESWGGFLKRLTSLEAGRRYQIVWSNTAEPDWSILDVGKIENKK